VNPFAYLSIFTAMSQKLSHFLIPHKKNNFRAHMLRPVALYTIVTFLLLLQLSFSFIARSFPSVLGISHSIIADDIIALTNDERGKLGLPPLRANGQLMVAAQRKGEDMLARGYWAHVAPDGKQPWAFIREAGYSYERAGENLAKDFTDSTSAVRAWMNSPGHRANIVNIFYQEIGVAVVSGPMNGIDTVIVVQMFGQPLGGINVTNLQNPVAAQAQVPQPKGVSIVDNSYLAQNVPDSQQVNTIPENLGSNLPADIPLRYEKIEQPAPMVNPSQTLRYASIGISAFLIGLFLLDIIFLLKHRVQRVGHGHSIFHLVFLITIILIAVFLQSGVIL
jgi:hypothetical protein